MGIYAKTTHDGGLGETLSEHTIRCLKVANIVAQNLPFDEKVSIQVYDDLKFALAIHDVGKACTGFQKSLIDKKRWGHRHEIVSAAFASHIGLKDEIIISIITHHKSLPPDSSTLDLRGCLPSEEIPWKNDLTPRWKQISHEWYENKSNFLEEWNKICDFLDKPDLKYSSELTPLNIKKQWMKRGKQVDNVPYGNRYYASLLRGLLVTCDHLASNSYINLGFMPKRAPILSDYILTKQVKNIRGFQKIASSYNGNVILRSPTGSGKTLAALLWAQKNQKYNGRLFYVLPNMASINAMYKRLKSIFGDYVGLLHSRVASSIYSFMEEDNSSKLYNQSIARTANSVAREIWYPIRVCTPHQVLRYTLHGKGWETMLSEFPNSCFIFDEIHAYEPKITGLILATTKFISNNDGKCMFLTATLPRFLRKILENEGRNDGEDISFIEPNIENKSDMEILSLKRHKVKILEGNIFSHLDSIVKAKEIHKSTLIVCNHVSTAQEVFVELSKHEKDIVLLHSRFARRDRNRIEGELLIRLPKILVSTQVIEVSLDIDFDQCFTEPAPIDALIQRFGRVNRYGKKPSVTVLVFNEQIGKYDIYNKELVQKSIKELSDIKEIMGEQEIVDVADRIYGDGYTGDDLLEFNEALNHPKIKNFEDSLVAGVADFWVDEIIEKLDGSIDVLPRSLLIEYQKLEEDGLRLESLGLLVPVFKKKMISLKNSTYRLDDGTYVLDIPYSSHIGLLSDMDLDSIPKHFVPETFDNII